ncbi:MAG: hypothetical protein EZS28_053844, partial [Streblomastix strix]
EDIDEFNDDNDEDEEEEQKICSVIHVEVRLIPIYPNHFGILPSLKMKKMLTAKELLEFQQQKDILMHLQGYDNEILTLKDLKSLIKGNVLYSEKDQQARLKALQAEEDELYHMGLIPQQDNSPQKRQIKSTSPITANQSLDSDNQKKSTLSSEPETKLQKSGQKDKKEERYEVEITTAPLYRPVKVQLLIFWAEANASIEHPYVDYQEKQDQ